MPIQAKESLNDIWQAETAAEATFDFFIKTHGAKHEKAATKRVKHRFAMLVVNDFPAEHWKQSSTPRLRPNA
ncbi:MAG: hypothetical protein CSA68_03210 [Rhodobacterales bacterium]|nr:MAG: hypothetical protein CSA68_03210 [Rhodobacterales bacterium]